MAYFVGTRIKTNKGIISKNRIKNLYRAKRKEFSRREGKGIIGKYERD